MRIVGTWCKRETVTESVSCFLTWKFHQKQLVALIIVQSSLLSWPPWGLRCVSRRDGVCLRSPSGAPLESMKLRMYILLGCCCRFPCVNQDISLNSHLSSVLCSDRDASFTSCINVCFSGLLHSKVFPKERPCALRVSDNREARCCS